MTSYKLEIIVAAKHLPTILSALEGTAQLLSVLPHQEEARVKKETKRTQNYANGKHLKGIRSDDLLIQILSSEARSFSQNEIEREFIKHEFAHSSVSPTISRLVKLNRVRRLGDKQYALAGTTRVSKGASA